MKYKLLIITTVWSPHTGDAIALSSVIAEYEYKLDAETAVALIPPNSFTGVCIEIARLYAD